MIVEGIHGRCAGSMMLTDNAKDASSESASLDRLGLGTVQFGLDYGISNTRGRCTQKETGNILAEAARLGIRLLDTAPSYGRAEEILGKTRPEQTNFDIVTKTLPIPDERLSRDDVRLIVEQIRLSCRNLDTTCVYGVLVHHAADLLKPGGEMLYASLEALKSDGLVSNIGVSVYDEAEVNAVMERYSIDIVQVPVNLFDQRLVLSGCLRDMKRQGVEIHARSVFLQGMLLMSAGDFRGQLEEVMPHLEHYESVLQDEQVGKLIASLAYVKGVSEIDVILVGVNSVEHLIQNSKAFVSACSLDFSEFAIADEKILDPRRWPKV